MENKIKILEILRRLKDNVIIILIKKLFYKID